MPYFEASGDMPLESYPALEALLLDGGLYYAPQCYWIMTCYTTEQTLLGRDSWSFEDYLELEASLSPGQSVFGDITAEEFLENCLLDYVPLHMNRREGRVDFDCAELAAILEAAKRAGEAGDGEALIKRASIGSLLTIKEIEEREGEISFIGWPTFSGAQGSYLRLTSIPGIVARSSGKDMAWDFIRRLIRSEEVQDDNLAGFLPVYQPVLEGYTSAPASALEQGRTRAEFSV